MGIAILAGTAVVGLLYLALVEGFHRPPGSTRAFDALVVLGVLASALATWRLHAPLWTALATVGVAVAWFVITYFFLVVPGTPTRVTVGDAFPAFDAVTTAEKPFALTDLLRQTPAVLVLYRGVW